MNPATATPTLSTAHSLGSAALNLIIVLALIFALAWVLRRVRGLRNNLPGQISIKATLSLSMKERVMLIDAAGEHLLIGVSPSGITKLHRYTKPLPEATVPENQFSTLLRRLNPHARFDQTGEKIVVANVEQPYKNFAEMISYAKANPEKISMGVSDAVTRVVATALEAAANVKFTIVPYKGGGPQNTDLLGNQIAAAIGTPNMMGFVDQGRLRAIVMSTPRRVPFLPQVPTVTESIPGSDFDVQTWYAIAGPAKMPEPVVRRLQEEVGKVMNQPEVRKKLDDLGVVTPADISSRATLTLMRDYQARMTKLVRAAGITPE